MSPEQASADRDLSARSDVYSLGCVLYEMLAGQPPHTGPSAQSVLVRILTEDPRPLTDLRRTVPPHVAATVTKSIEKLPADRFESAKEFMTALGDEAFTHAVGPRARATAAAGSVLPPGPRLPWHRDPRLVGSVGVAAVATALAAFSLFGRPQPAQLVQRYAIDMEAHRLDSRHKVFISPDGRRLAMSVNGDGGNALYWREISEERFQRLETDGEPFYPTFSPEGDWLAYVGGSTSEDVLMRVALSGGAPRAVVPSGHRAIFTPSWSADGTIVYGSDTGLWAVPGTGGEPRHLLEGLGWAVQPRLLPGSGALTYTDRRDQSTYVLDLDSDSTRLLIAGGIDATYVATGHVIFVDLQGGLWAQPFDVDRLQTAGDAVPMVSGLAVASGAFAKYSISDDGTLVYGIGTATGAGSGPPDERLMVVDLEGNGTILGLEPRDLAEVAWGPDGETLAFESAGPASSRGSAQIFTYNTVVGDVPRPLTFEGENEGPEWSPDGTRIVFSREAEGTDGSDLFVKTFGDDAPPELLVSMPGDQRAYDWPTEDVILFQSYPAGTAEIWIYDFRVDSAYVYLTSEGRVLDPALSPDGSLVAYTEFGEVAGIFVRSFPTPRQRELVVRGGDGRTVIEPRWSVDGNTIYYWASSGPDRYLVAARIRREPSFAVTATDTLFSPESIDRSAWDLHPDGDRFIVPVQADVASTAPSVGPAEPERFVVAVNWFEELRVIMGGN
jgi:serine/threonine-protein kinase